MKFNQWTLGLAAVGVVSLASAAQAQETANPVLTSVADTTISGYVDTSAQWNFGTGNANLPGYAFGAGKADGFNLNVAQISIAKDMDESSWAAGYHVDLWLGPDAKFLQTSSYASILNYASDLAIRQAYVSLRVPVGPNGLDLKMGVFDTVVGYESLTSPNNPHYTHSYGFSLEPTTHTGLLATYQVCEEFAVSAGVANTVGPAINERAYPMTIPLIIPYIGDSETVTIGGNKAESFKTYLGSFAVTAPESLGFLAGSTIYGGVVSGYSSLVADNQTSWYMGGTLNTPVSDLKLGASFDNLDVKNMQDAWATALYASFAATEKLTLLGRAEYLGFQNASEGNIFAITGTVQYDLWDNVLSRVELRWDHAEHGERFGGKSSLGNSAGSPDAENAFMLAANLIYKF